MIATGKTAFSVPVEEADDLVALATLGEVTGVHDEVGRGQHELGVFHVGIGEAQDPDHRPTTAIGHV